MHSRGFRPLASSRVLLIAASVSPAAALASSSVNSWQASTLGVPPDFPASEAPPQAASEAGAGPGRGGRRGRGRAAGPGGAGAGGAGARGRGGARGAGGAGGRGGAGARVRGGGRALARGGGPAPGVRRARAIGSLGACVP